LGKERNLNLLTSERGASWLSGLFTMLVLTIVIFIGIEVACYLSSYWKLRVACSETLALMKIENGFDAQIKQCFDSFLKVQGLDPHQDRVKVVGTAKTVQRGEVVTIRTEMPYTFRALKPLGKEFHLTIRVAMSGLAQEFIKQKN
jgi:hypothetical protein